VTSRAHLEQGGRNSQHTFNTAAIMSGNDPSDDADKVRPHSHLSPAHLQGGFVVDPPSNADGVFGLLPLPKDPTEETRKTRRCYIFHSSSSRPICRCSVYTDATAWSLTISSFIGSIERRFLQPCNHDLCKVNASSVDIPSCGITTTPVCQIQITEAES
jgi:hypothetical protein